MHPTTSGLDSLRVKNGFRLRGSEMTRIETFTDAAFAFAVTLLVISVGSVPESHADLIGALKAIPAFAISFALLMMFWSAHWTWSRRYGLDDTPTTLLSAALVFVVLCYVYPLKYLVSLFLNWMSGGMLATGASLDSVEQLYEIFAIYGVGFVAMCAIVILLNLHAWRQQQDLDLNLLERFDTCAELGAWSIVGGVGLLSVLAALFLPPSLFVVPGWIYCLLTFVMPIYGITVGRRRRALENHARSAPLTRARS